MDTNKMKIAYVITERNGRSFWNRVGVAFVNRDGSLSLRLDALPLNGELQIRDYNPKQDALPPELRTVGERFDVAQSA